MLICVFAFCLCLDWFMWWLFVVWCLWVACFCGFGLDGACLVVFLLG